MIRSQHARITNNSTEPDVIVEHLSIAGKDWIVLSNEGEVDGVRISPDAISILIPQLQGLIRFLNPQGPVSSRWR
jgi:hypothetical protein